MLTSLLLDTHVWIWLIQGDTKLPVADRALIEQARAAKALYVSVFSVWEVAMLVQSNRVQLHKSIEDWLKLSFGGDAIQLLPLTPKIAIASNRLPGEIHHDPADRILVATARTEDMTLLTSDRDILAYARQGHLLAKRI